MAGDGVVTMQLVVRSLLRLRLALSRFGTGTLLAGALLAAAALLWLGVLPGMSARVADETRSVARLRSLPVPKPVVPAPVLAAGRLADFYAGLGDSAHTGEIVMRLFEAAAAAGVTLDKAEYKPGHDAPGRFDTYTIVLPVKGDYARLRQFSEKVLVSVPYAALDDMRFKRNSANDPGVEANLRFTAFLRPVTIAPVSASAAAAAAERASEAAAVLLRRELWGRARLRARSSSGSGERAARGLGDRFGAACHLVAHDGGCNGYSGGAAANDQQHACGAPDRTRRVGRAVADDGRSGFGGAVARRCASWHVVACGHACFADGPDARPRRGHVSRRDARAYNNGAVARHDRHDTGARGIARPAHHRGAGSWRGRAAYLCAEVCCVPLVQPGLQRR